MYTRTIYDVQIISAEVVAEEGNIVTKNEVITEFKSFKKMNLVTALRYLKRNDIPCKNRIIVSVDCKPILYGISEDIFMEHATPVGEATTDRNNLAHYEQLII